MQKWSHCYARAQACCRFEPDIAFRLDDLDLDRFRIKKRKIEKMQKQAEVIVQPMESSDVLAESSNTAQTSNVQTLLSATRASITSSAKFFPFVVPEEVKTNLSTKLKKGISCNDVVLRVKLGVAKYSDVVGKISTVKCLLKWVEPFIWFMTQLRWTKRMSPAASQAEKRTTSTSWLELACAASVLTGKMTAPVDATFMQACAVTKQLWAMLAPYFVVTDGDTFCSPLKKCISFTDYAGAAITCGVSSAQGVDRRCIWEDMPGCSIAVASLIKFASKSVDRLRTNIPVCKWWKVKWYPSGMLEAHQQLRQLSNVAPIYPNQMQVDHQRWKRRRPPMKVALTGPCIFGCTVSTKANPTSRAKERWCHVPSPSPWPGVASGEVLCMKCYSWGVGNPRASMRRRKAAELPQDLTIKVGSLYEVTGLMNKIDLNGSVVKACARPDDPDRVLVKLGERILRLAKHNLAPLADDAVHDEFVRALRSDLASGSAQRERS